MTEGKTLLTGVVIAAAFVVAVEVGVVMTVVVGVRTTAEVVIFTVPDAEVRLMGVMADVAEAVTVSATLTVSEPTLFPPAWHFWLYAAQAG